MRGGPDCMCGGSGVIYDWSSKGDPCPECRTGFPSHMSSKVRYRADRAAARHGRGCAVTLALLAAAGSLIAAGARYL